MFVIYFPSSLFCNFDAYVYKYILILLSLRSRLLTIVLSFRLDYWTTNRLRGKTLERYILNRGVSTNKFSNRRNQNRRKKEEKSAKITLRIKLKSRTSGLIVSSSIQCLHLPLSNNRGDNNLILGGVETFSR